MNQIYSAKFLLIGHLSKQFQVSFTKNQYVSRLQMKSAVSG